MLTLAAASLLVASTSFADSDHHALWAVQGKHNTVYLLGSMHLLPASEQLPTVMDKAYQDSATVVMEIDMAKLDPLATQSLTMQLGLLPDGETLQQDIGPAATEKVAAFAKTLGIDITALAQFRPWLAAMTLTQIQMLKLGLDPQAGVEQRFVQRAAADHKQTDGLETVEQQLNLFAEMSDAQQTQYLLYTVEDASNADKELQAMLAAWRIGDLPTLTAEAGKEFQEFPALYKKLTVDRNRNWVAPLEKMLSDDKNYLVIVGIVHLAGKDGVLDLLSHQGYSIKQL